MLLPPTLNLSVGDVSVAAVNYGKGNPYETLGGSIEEGSSVNSFTLNGIDVKDLADPIVLSLPLPSSSRRRRLSEWNGTWPEKQRAKTYSVNCFGRNVSKLEALYSEEDLARAQFCGLELDLANKTRWVNYFEPWVNNSRKVWCNSTREWHYMDCEGNVGMINYTCPGISPVSSCLYWDTKLLSWSSAGCTYWRTDEIMGIAYCNCTHLTSFRSKSSSEFTESASTFADTTASVQDLTGTAVRKNLGILIILMLLWVGAACLYAYDRSGQAEMDAQRRLNDSCLQKYETLNGRMFQAVTKDKRPNNDSAINEDFREVEEPVDGMLYFDTKDQSLSARNRNAKTGLRTIDNKMKQFDLQLQDKKRALKNFLGALKEENQVVALFAPESYRREVFTKRSIFLLVEVLSLLFISCLYAPAEVDAYLCPTTKSTNVFGGGLLQPPSTTFLGLVVWYLKDSLNGCLVNVLLWPGACFVRAL